MREIDEFIKSWVIDITDEDRAEVKNIFIALYQCFKDSNLPMKWLARPGSCYSLCVSEQNSTSAFARLDVVDDDPEERWLSLCIKKALADDPANYGEVVPKILDEQDALCFAIDESNENIKVYLQTLLKKAINNLKPIE
jgi:hypothetical protein